MNNPRWFLNADLITSMMKQAVGLNQDLSNADEATVAEYASAMTAFYMNVPEPFGIEIRRTTKVEVRINDSKPNWTHPRFNPVQPRSEKAPAVLCQSDRGPDGRD